MNNYIIVASDNTHFHVNISIINYSSALRYILSKSSDNLLYINIKSHILSHILTFIRLDLSRNHESHDVITKLVYNMNIDTLMDIIIAAKYLDINDLLIICKQRFKEIIESHQ